MKNITIKQLASKLKLSVSTISKALHDSHEISAKTKLRVMQSARRLHYIPNPYASSLRGKKSKNIGVVIPEVADSFFSLAINGIESVANEKGYHVLIYLTHEKFSNEKKILKEFQCGRVDGVIISVTRETSNSDHITNVMSEGIPLIFFDRVCEDVQTAKITTDDFESGYFATEHLLKRGCSKVAFLSISKSLSINRKRMEGYKRALQQAGILVQDKYIVECGNDVKQNYLIIKKMLQKIKPDGVLASVEKLTTPLYEACHFMKLKIPEDVKVVCFSNLETASILNPPLTTVTQPAFEIGKTAALVLFNALAKSSYDLSGQVVTIPSSLIARTSTG